MHPPLPYYYISLALVCLSFAAAIYGLRTHFICFLWCGAIIWTNFPFFDFGDREYGLRLCLTFIFFLDCNHGLRLHCLGLEFVNIFRHWAVSHRALFTFIPQQVCFTGPQSQRQISLKKPKYIALYFIAFHFSWLTFCVKLVFCFNYKCL